MDIEHPHLNAGQVISASRNYNPLIDSVNELAAPSRSRALTRPQYFLAKSDADYPAGSVLAVTLSGPVGGVVADVEKPTLATLTFATNDMQPIKESGDNANNTVRLIGFEYPVLLQCSGSDPPQVGEVCGIAADDETVLSASGSGFVCLSSVEQSKCWAIRDVGKDGFLFKTDDIGITARDGTTRGSGEVYLLADDLTPVSESKSVVYNWSAKEVTEDTYGIGKFVHGLPWVDNADCHPDPEPEPE